MAEKKNSTFKIYRGGAEVASVEGLRIIVDGQGKHVEDVDGDRVYTTGDHSVEILKVK